MLGGGELVGVWPEGFKGIGKPYAERYKLQRFGRGGFVSAAMRTGVPDHPAVGRRRRGDLPAGRQHPVAGPAARRPLHPDHAVLPAARPARAGPAAVEVAAGVRRADPHRRVRRRRGRRPDAGLQRDRPGARDDPADALLAADEAAVGLPLAERLLRRSVVPPPSSGSVRPSTVSSSSGRQRQQRLLPVVVRGVLGAAPPSRPSVRSPSGLLGWVGRRPAAAGRACRPARAGSARCRAAVSRRSRGARGRPACRRPCRLVAADRGCCGSTRLRHPAAPMRASREEHRRQVGDAAGAGRAGLLRRPRRSGRAPGRRGSARRGPRPGTVSSSSVSVAMLSAVKVRSSSIEVSLPVAA